MISVDCKIFLSDGDRGLLLDQQEIVVGAEGKYLVALLCMSEWSRLIDPTL